MANHQWQFDAPSGVYKNHELSSQIREAAVAESKFMQFVSPEPNYGKKKGEAVTIIRVSNVDEPTDATLTEGVVMPEDEFSLSTVQITVSEYGRSIPYTSLSEDLAVFDIANKIQRKLMDQMKLTMDKACAAAFKTAKVKAIPTGISELTMDTDGTASSAGVANLNYYHLEQIRDYMATTLHVPFYSGEEYIGLVSTKGCRGLKNDPKFEEWNKYTSADKKMKGEIGKIESIRIVEVNNPNALSGSKGTGSVQGEAVFFGADAVAMAVAEDPHLRAKVPTDYGRSKGVAWYGILAFGLIWDTANDGEARVVHFTSS